MALHKDRTVMTRKLILLPGPGPANANAPRRFDVTRKVVALDIGPARPGARRRDHRVVFAAGLGPDTGHPA